MRTWSTAVGGSETETLEGQLVGEGLSGEVAEGVVGMRRRPPAPSPPPSPLPPPSLRPERDCDCEL